MTLPWPAVKITELVYRERSRDPLHERDSLPIPAGHPDTVVEALPLPGSGEG